MIKTSGYRVSPLEVEEIVYATQRAGECVAIGVPDIAPYGIYVVDGPLPRNPNGKIDRRPLGAQWQERAAAEP